MRPPRLVFTSELRQSRRSNQRVRGRIDVERKERLRVGPPLGETPLQTPPRSADRAWSPAQVSQKYFLCGLETIETESQFAKGRNWRALIGITDPHCLVTGWRRSADRTRLHAISLRTGNFTGNFANSGVRDALSRPEDAVPQ
jgi:hypothetical protein